MADEGDNKFAPLWLPDITQVDQTKTTKLSSKIVSNWRIISKGLNL